MTRERKCDSWRDDSKESVAPFFRPIFHSVSMNAGFLERLAACREERGVKKEFAFSLLSAIRPDAKKPLRIRLKRLKKINSGVSRVRRFSVLYPTTLTHVPYHPKSLRMFRQHHVPHHPKSFRVSRVKKVVFRVLDPVSSTGRGEAAFAARVRGIWNPADSTAVRLRKTPAPVRKREASFSKFKELITLRV